MVAFSNQKEGPENFSPEDGLYVEKQKLVIILVEFFWLVGFETP